MVPDKRDVLLMSSRGHAAPSECAENNKFKKYPDVSTISGWDQFVTSACLGFDEKCSFSGKSPRTEQTIVSMWKEVCESRLLSSAP